VAIKIVEDSAPGSIEAIALSNINHPNIVRYYYSGKNLIKKDGNPVYTIMMDFVDGKTAREYVQLVNPVPIEELHNFAYQLIDAALYLEGKGMRHGDIHFNNAIITPKRDIVLVDLGLASSCKQPSPYPPNRRFGGPNDFVSIAQLIYFMATGEHLFAWSPGTTITGTDIADEIAEERARVMADSGGELLKEYERKIITNISGNHNNSGLLMSIVEDCLRYGCASNGKDVGYYKDKMKSYIAEKRFATKGDS
jgi:serine/threonine protein kinase